MFIIIFYLGFRRKKVLLQVTFYPPVYYGGPEAYRLAYWQNYDSPAF